MIMKNLQVALEILELLAPRCHISPLCRELFHLLQTPHLQVRIFIAQLNADTHNKSFFIHKTEFNVRTRCRCSKRLSSSFT